MQRVGRFKWLFISSWVWLLTVSTTLAHVGSPGVIMQRTAGKYRVMIRINPPDVIPGTAAVTVWVEQGRVRTVQARPIYFKAGEESSPVYDELKAVTSQQDQFTGTIWLMDIGASSVNIHLTGADGVADLVVPLTALATAKRTMPLSTVVLLTGLGILLFVLLITIVWISSGESISPPGQSLRTGLRRTRRIATGLAVVGLAVVLMGGRAWWNKRAREYYQYVFYRPPVVKASIQPSTAGSQIRLTFEDAPGRPHAVPLSFLIPDHGKLMHLFMARLNSADAFAHLHPQRIDTLNYQTTLPPLPPGQYRLFADVVYRNGFTETLTDTVTIAAFQAKAVPVLHQDDSWLVGQPSAAIANAVRLDASMAPCGVPAARATLADGSIMLWTDRPAPVLATDRLYQLRFAVATANGVPAPLEPYLGMTGHAIIMQKDGNIYTHLHPVGTASMAAETSLTERIADTSRTFTYPDAQRFRDSIDHYIRTLDAMPAAERNRHLAVSMAGMVHESGDVHSNMVEFPYQFPQAGTYRIWVQVKRNGQVLTGVFDADVTAD